MWEHAAQLRRGGLSYSDIQGRLAGADRTRFGLIKVPSTDTIRYQLEKQSLLAKPGSPLPPDELVAHYRALTVMGRRSVRR